MLLGSHHVFHRDNLYWNNRGENLNMNQARDELGQAQLKVEMELGFTKFICLHGYLVAITTWCLIIIFIDV